MKRGFSAELMAVGVVFFEYPDDAKACEFCVLEFIG